MRINVHIVISNRAYRVLREALERMGRGGIYGPDLRFGGLVGLVVESDTPLSLDDAQEKKI